MKTRGKAKSCYQYTQWIVLALLTLIFASCKDNDDTAGDFDPNKPVVISELSPKERGPGTRVLLYGKNFGSDIPKIKVTIGGQDSKVVGVRGKSFYCVVPAKAYDGDTKLNILNDEGKEIVNTEISEKLVYQEKMLVITLLRTMYDGNIKYDLKDGPLDDCGDFGDAVWLFFDPRSRNHLYLVDEQHPTRLINLEREYVSTVYSGLSKVRTTYWTHEADSMTITNDQNNNDRPNNYTPICELGFKVIAESAESQNCSDAEIHPINGELYFNSRNVGQVFRYDFITQGTIPLFTIQDSGWEFCIQFYPSENYAYIIVVNQYYILRSDCDWKAKRLTTPYIVCGQQDAKDRVGGVGKKARMHVPRQGTPVKSSAYKGSSDEYDFYLCDRENHCVRILISQSRVMTSAGRGSNGTSEYNDDDLRQEAHLNHLERIVYDKEREYFFIGDRENRRIRKIGYEE